MNSDDEEVQPFAVLATPEERRHLNALPEKILHAAMTLIRGALAEEPQRCGNPLVGELEGLWSARRADYRVIYEIDLERRTIVVHRVEHRRDVYRRGRWL